MRVFLNPGHAPNGVLDPGAVNPVTGDRECDLVLVCAEMVKELLEQDGLEVFLEQSDNLAEVCEHENIWGADVFVSLHTNACQSHRARGAETWYKSERGKRLAFMIQDCIVRMQHESIDRGIKHTDSFFVLNKTQAPAALVELGFIDNSDDLTLLKSKMSTFARAVASAIKSYLKFYVHKI